jgi:hypothetical protein
VVAARQSHELGAELVDGPGAAEQGQLAQRRVGHRRPEARVDEPNELGPRRYTVVQLQTVKPKLGVIQ